MSSTLHPGGLPAARAARGIGLVFLLALLLQLPSLGIGFFADDYLQQLALSDDSGLVPTPTWNLYDFGERADWEAFTEARGAFPWWTDVGWKARFLRPIPSLLLAAEHALWGSWAPGYHLTSLVLWMALLALAQRLFVRAGLSERATLAAMLVLACSDSSSIPVGWIANRNSLLEGLFATAALTCVLGKGPPPGARTIGRALVLAAAATLSKESGAVTLLLVALILRSRGRTALEPDRRVLLMGAWVAAALLVAYGAWIGLAGYGTRSGYYATPWIDPLRSLGNLALLVTGGTLAAIGPFSLDAVFAFPAYRAQLVLGLGSAGLLLGWPLARMVFRAVSGRPRMGWLGLWMGLALLPQCGVLPGDRLLFVPTIALAGVLGTYWDVVREHWARLGRVSRSLHWSLGFLVVGLSGLFLAAQNNGLAKTAEHLRRTALATEVGAPGAEPREIVVLQTESQMQAFTLAATWAGEGGDRDVRFRLLQAGPRPLRWSRPSERVFEFETLGDPFLDRPFENVYRVSNAAPPVGARWTTTLFDVEALVSDGGGLRRIRLEFLRSPNDAMVRFVRAVDGVLTRIEAPGIGQSIELEAPTRSGPFIP